MNTEVAPPCVFGTTFCGFAKDQVYNNGTEVTLCFMCNTVTACACSDDSGCICCDSIPDDEDDSAEQIAVIAPHEIVGLCTIQ